MSHKPRKPPRDTNAKARSFIKVVRLRFSECGPVRLSYETIPASEEGVDSRPEEEATVSQDSKGSGMIPGRLQ